MNNLIEDGDTLVDRRQVPEAWIAAISSKWRSAPGLPPP